LVDFKLIDLKTTLTEQDGKSLMETLL